MRRLALVLVFVGSMAGVVAVVATAVVLAQTQAGTADQAAPKPAFQFGFAALAAQIPDVVGVPLDNEQRTATGSMQPTSNGVMVWRSADNWTGFTDGSRSWIVGPQGIAVRGNNDRLPFESMAPLTFDDPVSYCAAVGTIDQFDSRYTGPTEPEVVRAGLAAAFGNPNALFPEQGVFLRCVDRQLLACTVGANLNCGMVNTSATPTTAEIKYCQDNPNSDFIPLVVVGHDGIYDWQCRAGQPSIARQASHVDPRGFVQEFWHLIPPATGEGVAGGVAPSPVKPTEGGGQPMPTGPAIPQSLLDEARADVANRAGVAPDQLSVVSVESVEWRDSSLGCPEPGRMYLQVITPGYRIVLQAGGNSYEYHSDQSRRVVPCDRPASAQ